MADLKKPEKPWLMLTVIGKDRPGIVARITEQLFHGGCNLGEASMARLGGDFTIMLMVQAASESAVQGMLQPLADGLGVHIHIDPMDGGLHAHLEPNVQVTVHGADRPGIVAQVTDVLSRNRFNILDLYSDVGGTAEHPIYVMVIDGQAESGAAAIESAVQPLRSSGIEIRVNSLDTLVG